MASSTTAKAIAKQANALPEFITINDTLIALAQQALTARAEKTQAELDETHFKTALAQESSAIRKSESLKDNFVGTIRIVKGELDIDMPPVRVDFKLAAKDSALPVTEMDTLNDLFGALRPQLWDKDKAITEINDPSVLIKAMTDGGLNPWDYLEVKVKSEMEPIVARYPGVTAVEALLPKSGFLSRLQEFGRNLSNEAKNYVRAYLDRALSPAVNLGAKGKA